MNIEDMEKQANQKRDLTVMGVLIIVSLFVASFVISDNTDKAFMWGFGVGVVLSAIYWVVRRLLDKRSEEEDD
jgi:uncharacterized membrane protein YfcA